jgi:hypothetical protein
VKDLVTVVTRLRLDAALYEPAPERKAGQNGRPRKQGEPTPAQVRDSPQTLWATATVAH